MSPRRRLDSPSAIGGTCNGETKADLRMLPLPRGHVSRKEDRRTWTCPSAVAWRRVRMRIRQLGAVAASLSFGTGATVLNLTWPCDTECATTHQKLDPLRGSTIPCPVLPRTGTCSPVWRVKRRFCQLCARPMASFRGEAMTKPSYDTDLYAWTQVQAKALRTKQRGHWTSTTWRRRSSA